MTKKVLLLLMQRKTQRNRLSRLAFLKGIFIYGEYSM